jgi:uncharacterized protein
MPARHHPNGLRIIDQDLIDEIVRTIVDALHPRRVVLFGSQALGDAGPDSDLDLMIEMDTHMRHLDRMVTVGELFPQRDWPLDVVVYTPAEVARDRHVVGTLLHMIESNGHTLYDESTVTA